MSVLSQLLPPGDTIFLKQVPFNIPVGRDAWGRLEKRQPVSIDLQIPFSVDAAASGDDVSRTLDYGKLYKRICSKIDNGVPEGARNINELGEWVEHALDDACRGTLHSPFLLSIELPKATLRCLDGVRYTKVREIMPQNRYTKHLEIRKLNCSCIVGVNPHERLEKQNIYISLEFSILPDAENQNNHLFHVPSISARSYTYLIDGGYQSVVRYVTEQVSHTEYETIESLASFVAYCVTTAHRLEAVTVTIEKPSAIASIEASGVRITRTGESFKKNPIPRRE